VRKEKSYRASRFGNTLLLRAVVGSGSGNVLQVQLLVDTGASYTMLPVEVIEKLGYDTHHPLRQVQLTSANGIVVAPLVAVSWFNCLGQLLKNFRVLAHTLPSASFDGVLGMDFLTRCRAIISVEEAEIRCRKPKAKRS